MINGGINRLSIKKFILCLSVSILIGSILLGSLDPSLKGEIYQMTNSQMILQDFGEVYPKSDIINLSYPVSFKQIDITSNSIPQLYEIAHFDLSSLRDQNYPSEKIIKIDWSNLKDILSVNIQNKIINIDPKTSDYEQIVAANENNNQFINSLSWHPNQDIISYSIYSDNGPEIYSFSNGTSISAQMTGLPDFSHTRTIDRLQWDKKGENIVGLIPGYYAADAGLAVWNFVNNSINPAATMLGGVVLSYRSMELIGDRYIITIGDYQTNYIPSTIMQIFDRESPGSVIWLSQPHTSLEKEIQQVFWDNNTEQIIIAQEGLNQNNNILVFNSSTDLLNDFSISSSSLLNYSFETNSSFEISAINENLSIIASVKAIGEGYRISLIDYTDTSDNFHASKLVAPIFQTIDDLQWNSNGTILAVRSGDKISFLSIDMDNDQMADVWEIWNNLDVNINDAYLDKDGDGLSNLEEFIAGTIANNTDSDYDGMGDKFEVDYGLNATMDDSASDLDNDGLTNIEEYELGTFPNDADTDGDGMSDGDEVANGSNPLVADQTSITPDTPTLDLPFPIIVLFISIFLMSVVRRQLSYSTGFSD